MPVRHRVRLATLCSILSVTFSSFVFALDRQHPPVEPAPVLANETGKKYPEPAPAADSEKLGVGVQRAMTLMATSTPEHHNKVRVLFYGQSITEQEWSKYVADDLRRRFPNANLEIENRAIGGFASQLLIRPAEHDLYPFYPDLVIFHVYGGEKDYEKIIQSIRSRTTADVLMQTDHATSWPPETVDRTKDKGMWWDDFMNHVFLPETAKKYGCGLVDIRTDWLAYLRANTLEPKALLKDGVHLNEYGNFLMARLIERYLVYRPELAKTSWQENVKDIALGDGMKWENGALSMKFDGNRIDAILAEGTQSAEVLIDGKKPSQFPECYAITRPQPGPWSPLFIARVDHTLPLVLEEWTYTVTKAAAPGANWTFDVSGSVTGPDGSGSSDQIFASTSGRVKILPEVYFRNSVKSVEIPKGYRETWKVVPHFADTVIASNSADATREQLTTLAQGLSNGEHTLELKGSAGCPIKALRVYQPPVK